MPFKSGPKPDFFNGKLFQSGPVNLLWKILFDFENKKHEIRKENKDHREETQIKDKPRRA